MALPKDGTNSKPAATSGSTRTSPAPRPGAAPTPTTSKPSGPTVGPVAPGSPAAKSDPSRVANPVAPKKPTAKKPATPATTGATATGSMSQATPTQWIVGQNLTTVHVAGLTFTCAAQAAPKFIGFINALVAAGYHPKVVEGYNDRDIAGTNKKSNHAYGAAIDIDPGANPRYGNAAGGKFALPPNVGDIAAKYGLNWGGNYKNSKDYMHFEDATAPASSGAAAQKDHAGTGSTAASGGAAAGSTDTSAPLPSTPQEVDDAVAAQYGYLAAFLHDPELGPILRQAAKEGWDSDRLQGAIYKTKWYQNHSNTTRQFDAQTRLDPATQKQQIMAQADDIVAQAKKSGLSLDQKSVAQLAWTSLRYGWTGQQLANAITAQGKMDLSGKTPNAALATVDGLREQAKQYMVPVSDKQLSTWARQIISGQFTAQDFTSYVKEQAKSLFPTLAASIDRGVTVEQYADPYRNMAAQTLEIDPNAVDFMNDPKYSKAMYSIDPKTKERTPMSLSDWGTYLRGLPDYAKTAQANQQAAGMATSILNTFGQVAS